MLLPGKVAIITGAATGIGQNGAHVFAREGAKVVIADINDKNGEETAKGIREQGNEATFVHTDVTSVSDIEGMVKTTVGIYGQLDIFWHNAGGILPGHIDLVEEADYDREMAIELKGAIFGTKFAIREMRKIGGGCILFTSSMLGLRPNPYWPSFSLTYGIAKASQVMLVRCLTEPLARDNIRINCICPGPVQTPGAEARHVKVAEIEGISREEELKRRIGRIPLGRAVTMDEVADAALFLVSDKASAITGVALAVDGGFAAL